MGTNYYYLDDEKELHIGKSSFGWVFAMRIHKYYNINSYEDWKRLFNIGIIMDEYGEQITTEKMKKIIEDRKPTKRTSDDIIKDYYTEMAPNGLYRTKLGSHCVAHFETWELVENEFS